MPLDLDARFPRYTEYDPAVGVWCVTPELAGTFHRFFDTSPISPSGRYLAATRLPAEGRMPEIGEPAEVILVDLATGEARTVAETRGWDTQLGAQAQWGATDAELYFNDMDVAEWRPFGVRLDPATGERLEMEGTVYMVAPDGRSAVSADLLKTGITQAGYGVIVPPDRVGYHTGAPDDDGVYLTDTATGKRRMLLSTRAMLEATGQDTRREGGTYLFHTKFNSRCDRIMVVVRHRQPDGNLCHQVITFDMDGGDVHVATPESEWTVKGGHHPDWCPDGDHVMMNLAMAGRGTPMRLVRARYDGADLASMTDAVVGSRHPAMHPDGRHVVTDAYPHEPLAYGDGATTPLRWIDVEAGSESVLARIRTVPDYAGPKGELRVDPHPAWDPTARLVAFNACPDGERRVFIADLSALL